MGRNADGIIVHDADYRQSKKDFDGFVECLTEKIIEKDETIPELPAKDLVCHILYLLSYLERDQGAYDLKKTFRIYRDVRFSSDPTPYKVISTHS